MPCQRRGPRLPCSWKLGIVAREEGAMTVRPVRGERRVAHLLLAALTLLATAALAEVRLPPGFVKDVYVTGQGFDTSGERGVTEAFFAFLERAGGALSSLADIYGDRLRASTKETIWNVGVAVIAGLALLLWIGSATLATVRGLCGAVTFLSGGEEWLGELAGGLLALILAAGALAAGTRWSNRKQLQALELKYGKHDTNGAGADTPAIPRPPAGAGDAPAGLGSEGAR